ncbi:MAG: hypothetical protein K1000chlam2_01127 [Chlamydiae bacterium]|nr:hypothetical protein [Chlamydiota bacterium]
MQKVLFEEKSYQISSDAMPEMLKEKLNQEQLKCYLKLLDQVQLQPKAVYAEIKAFGQEYPTVPEVINLLTFAHIQNHRVVEAENLIEDTFEKHPEYLFARINYADQCIRKKKLSKIPKIFPTFDLKELYPEKEIFHLSEFRGFFIMMTYYQIALKDREKAIYYFTTAKEIEPHHPSVLYLEKKLFRKSLFQRLLRLKK